MADKLYIVFCEKYFAMGSRTCSACGGSGYANTVDSFHTIQRDYSTLCGSCNGSGSIYVPDPSPAPKSRPAPRSSTSTSSKPSSNSSSLGDLFAVAGFIIGAVFSYNQFDGDIWATLIGGAILAVIGKLTYKLIIGIAVLLFILYLIGQNA